MSTQRVVLVTRERSCRAFLDGRAEPPYSEAFFEAVWEDELVAAELERRLRSTATFEAFELIAS